MRSMIRALCLAAATVLSAGPLAVVAAAPAAAAAGVNPSSVELTLRPGESTTIAATVTTPTIAPNPDIVLLADTTGSMQPALANVSQNIRRIVSEVQAAQPTAQFAVAEYKEQRNQRAFHINTPLTPDVNGVANGVDDWLVNVGGGGAPWTDFINAHYRIGTDAVSFRPNSTRIVAWFGDARSHDPSLGHTLQDAINSLRSQGVRVIAIPLDGTTGGGLDALGQATAITTGTGGVLTPPSAANAVAQSILDGIRALEQTVAPAVTSCDSALTVGFDPTTRTVRSGTNAEFHQTIGVREGTAAGTHTCMVDFRVGGASAGYVQTITVQVPGQGPSLSVGDVSVVEGDSGTANAVFTVSLGQPGSTPVTVDYATADGTAVSSSDFTATSGVLTIPAGVASVTLGVPIVGDMVDETNETFTVELSNPIGAGIADGQGVGTIVDDDDPVPPPALSIGDVTVKEGDSGTTPATFAVSLSHAATSPVTVQWTTNSGTADDADVAPASGSLTFAPGETSETVTAQVQGDLVDEPDETFSVELSNATGATIADGSGVGTIVDDDQATPPVVSIGDVTVDEGAGSASFTVALDRASADPATVHFATAGGTATAPADFAATSGDLTFAPGQVSKQVTVPIVGDAVDEPNETFTVTLSGPAGATIGDGSGVGTIVDDDRDGAFTCRASVLSVVANPPNAPCVNDSRSAASLDVNLGLLRIQASAPRAATTSAADAANATAALGTTRISTLGLVVEVGATTATATARCVAAPGGGRAPAYSGSSSIGTLKINGIPVQVGSTPVTIPLVVGSLRLNGTTTTPTGVTQRAIELRSVLGNVVLGEARAGVTGTPAHPAGNPCQGGA